MDFETIKKIDKVMGRINTHPEYSSSVAAHYSNHLRAEADKHSTWMEIESGKKQSKKDLEKVRETSLNNLNAGYHALASEGLNVFTFAKLGNIVEPEGHPYSMFRKDVKGTCYSAGGIEFPSSSRVPDLVRNISDYLNESENTHPVIRAVNTHLSLVATHPYEDGNGRVARLVERFALEQRAYPPAVITTDERPLYIALISPAVVSWLSHKNPFNVGETKEERIFQTFMETKILQSANKIEEELKKRRIYDINLEAKNKEQIYTLKRKLESFASHDPNKNIHIKVNELGFGARQAKLEIRGNVSTEEVASVLEKNALRVGVKYHFEPRKGC